MKPRIFVGSSVETLPIAYAVQSALQHDAEVTVWSQGIFFPSTVTIAAIFAALDESDFGAFILGADDLTNVRGNAVATPRDNVVFELGVFAGRLGIGRTFFLIPDGVANLHLPTDLAGVTPLRFPESRSNIDAAIGPACQAIRQAVSGYVSPRGTSSNVTIVMPADRGSEFATFRLGTAESVRIVGTARQEVLDTSVRASGYLAAAEDRVMAGGPFSYLRITSSELIPTFRDHLGRLLASSRKQPGKVVAVSILRSLDASLSYTIFDDKEVLLVIDNNMAGGVRDNRMMIWSRDRDVVTAFSRHFDEAWTNSTERCTTRTHLERVTTSRRRRP